MIVITGAAGFIGSNLAHRLSTQTELLLLVDHPLVTDKMSNWVGLSRFIFHDHHAFLDLLGSRPPPIDIVFHLGACSKTTESNWEYLQRNNIEYSQKLWSWCAANDCPFIYASSASTYGDGNKGFFDQRPPEELKPLNLYARSKNDFDSWALRQQSEGNPCPPAWAGLKFFNVYGPRETHKGPMASVIYKAVREIKATGSIKLFESTDHAIANGGQKRDFVFVEDCIDHLVWLGQHESAAGLYNSGTGIAHSFNDLATAIFQAMGVQPSIDYVSMTASLQQHYQNYTQAVMHTLKAAGFNQQPTCLLDGVKKTVDWILSSTDELIRSERRLV